MVIWKDVLYISVARSIGYVCDLDAAELTITLYRLCFVALVRSKCPALCWSGWVMVRRLHRRVYWLVGSCRDSWVEILSLVALDATIHQPLANGTAATWTAPSQPLTLFVCSSVSSSSRLRFSPRGISSSARVLRPVSNCPAIRSEKLACGSNATWTCCIAGQTRLPMSSVGLSSAWRSFEGM